MGKGDKKSKRGKIVLGTYGVRRLRKKSVKAVGAVKAKEETVKPVAKEEIVKPVAKEEIAVQPVEAAVEEPKVVKEKVAPKAAKPPKEKKETPAEKPAKAEKQAKEPKAKKEKKAE